VISPAAIRPALLRMWHLSGKARMDTQSPCGNGFMAPGSSGAGRSSFRMAPVRLAKAVKAAVREVQDLRAGVPAFAADEWHFQMNANRNAGLYLLMYE